MWFKIHPTVNKKNASKAKDYTNKMYICAEIYPYMTIADKLKDTVREIPDFPIKGVLFKDISTIFLHPSVVKECGEALAAHWKSQKIDKILAIDSRGFLFAPLMSIELGVGLVMVRKKGKLPPETIGTTYQLEYGTATIEVVKSSIQPGDRVIIHDDLLATGGTARAAAALATALGAEVVGFSFLIELGFLGGRKLLEEVNNNIHVIANYDN